MSAHKFLFLTRWLLCCLLFFVTRCTNKTGEHITGLDKKDYHKQGFEKAYKTIQQSKQLIVDGDLILRTGNDFTSQSLRQLSHHDKTYSHCGIALKEKDSIFVYHALGGEWNPDEKLKRDPLDIFCRPEDNKGFGIFHFALNKLENHRLDSVVKAWHNKGITFDMQFDLSTDDKMYCAEFVSKAITSATDNRITFEKTRINNFFFISIDNLFINPYCKQKIKYTFEP